VPLRVQTISESNYLRLLIRRQLLHFFNDLGGGRR
jgi:hypothetical protein